MREKDEGKASTPRRFDDAHVRVEDDAGPHAAQHPDTLREGYSWVRALEARHPSWRLQGIEGFPFTLPELGLSESRVAIISLAGVYRKGQKPFNTSPGVVPPRMRAMRFRDRGDWSFREIAKDCDPADLGIAHAHYDHADADEDINCVFPLARLRELEEEDFIGECAPTHYAMMGYVPEVEQILATTRDEILPRLEENEIDAVVVCGGCELSHQSAGLVQRVIEEAGLPTVGVSVCHDITYQLQVPRAVSLRFPLCNPFGASMDVSMQARILRDGLALIESARTPGEVVALPYEWVKA